MLTPHCLPVASPYTGQLASFGEGVKNGAILKGEEVNAAGAINDKQVEIILEDEMINADGRRFRTD